MKISAKLLVVTFTVVVSITGISALIYYSLTNSLLDSQYSKSILNSTSDFANYLLPVVNSVDEEGARLAAEKNNFNKKLDGYETDFFFRIVNDSLIDFSSFKIKDTIYLNRSSRSIKAFVRQNRNIILRAYQEKGNAAYFYGKVISAAYLNRIAEKIRAELALLINDNIYEISHSDKNGGITDIILSAAKKLKLKNNYDLQYEHLEDSDFIASIFNSRSLSVAEDKITFIVFNNAAENFQFRGTIKLFLLVVLVSGIALTLVLVLLFTTKIRKQISLLNESAEITAKGDLSHRVKIISKDEIGRFGGLFNKMLDELQRIKNTEKEYLDFLTLLNQNPSLKEISEAVLEKIINGTGLTFGVIYLVEGKSMSVVSSHGVSREFVQPVQSANFYSKAIEEKDEIEFIFKDNYPEIRTGLAFIKIKYLLIFPIIYNKEVIAIIEVASETVPNIEVKKYLANIHDQLAIGLINAKSLTQLENYIDELKKLNEEYQKQNIQITGQNEKLLELHNQLKEKAEELEEKRNQAVQLTRVKSQFLANMSHELKTPLISIIGLTDLTLKEQNIDRKMKDRFSVVYRNGKKLLNMINNILEFSKFESGNVEVKSEVFLLNELLGEIKDNIQPLAAEKGLSFGINYQQSEVLVNTDRILLERILLNLLFNAVKFTDKGSIELVISFINKKDIEFIVSDTGIGISDENQKIIFEEFKQAEEGSTKTYSGAGLGLAISKRYIEMLGGTISVKSKTGAGTKFKVGLPGIIVEIMSSLPVEESREPVRVPENFGKTALLVSENEHTKKLLQDYLLNYHIMLSHVKSIKELQKTNSKDYSALYIDINSEEYNIWNTISVISKRNSNLHILVIRMIEEEKVGYGLYADNLIFGYNDYKQLPNVTMQRHDGKKVKKICIVHSEDESKRKYSHKIEGVVSYKYDGWEKLSAYVTANSIDALVIEMLEPAHDSIEIIYKLRTSKGAKNLYVALNLPEDISNETARLLYEEINSITLKAKFHPMDVLKVVRDKMRLVEESDKPDYEEEPVVPAPEAEVIQEPSKRILIVDDDNDTLFTIGELVNGVGYEAVYAHNGVECLAVLAKKKPDLILLDIMMPQMDGFETIKHIRNDEAFKDIPVAALTAYEMLDNKEVTKKHGFTDIITKPIDSNTLAFKIEKLLTAKE
jgi:signal transduction histidine kinase/CheY-like chemotaxis protein/HAMP domain-containing protein